MQSQSTTARQLRASILSVKCLLPTSVFISEIVAKKIKAHRDLHVSRMAWIIEGEYESLPAWVDAFCHSCDINECARSTPLELAEIIFDQGWTIENGLKGSLLLCPSCTCGEEVGR